MSYLIRVLARLVLVVMMASCATTRAGLGDDRPVIVAHRGFSHVAPENTLIAFQKAIDVGSRFAECDVHLSADGTLVLMHDESLERTTGLKRAVLDVELEELRQLEASRWFCGDIADEQIPTLSEALDLVRGKLRFIIELKAKGTAVATVELLEEKDVSPDEVIIFSFKLDEVAKAVALMPELYGVYLIHEAPEAPEERQAEIDRAIQNDMSGIGFSYKRLDAAFLERAHAHNLDVLIYTVNEEPDIRALIELGVDAVITDRPDIAQKILFELRNP